MIYTFNGYRKTAHQMMGLLGIERWYKIIEEASKVEDRNNYHTMVTVYGNVYEVVIYWNKFYVE